jgi:eukaryotic-like serine/threonine-protein kinase
VQSDRWQQLQRVFNAALLLPDDEARRVFVEQACGGDAELVAEVTAMLQEDARGDSLLDRDIQQIAGSMLGAAAPPSGTRIGRYTVKRLLGEGGMGVVCLAGREDLGSEVAIKVLRDAWLSPARQQRFRDEQRVLAQLNHPGIARLYDADALADGTPWFAMEFVEGRSLTDFCRDNGCSVERRLRLLRQACEAVRYAHAHAIIHRDIKPSNIMVTDDGTVKLLDFGIAKQLDTLDGSSSKTRTVLRLMTPAYAAPEQLVGDNVGVQADVYSLGVVLYELLTSRLPYDVSQLSATEASSRLKRSSPTKPSERAAVAAGRAAWPDLDVLCLTAMHSDRSQRYSSIEALIRDIDHYLDREPLEARPERLGYRAGKFLRRHWQLASVITTAIVLGLVLSVFFTLRLTAARDEALAEAARTERVQRFMMNLFQGGDAQAGPRVGLMVTEMLEQGVRDAETLASDPAVQSELLHNIASIYQQLGSLDEAESLFTRSLERRRELFGRNSPQVAESLVALGLLRIDQARLDEGEELIREGLALDDSLLPSGHPATVAARLALGQALRAQGEFDQAIALLEQTVALQSASGAAPIEQAEALAALADAHYSAGHYDDSRDIYHDVLERHRAIVGDAHPLVAGDIASLAAIEQDLGYYDKAEALSREALAINERYYGANSPHTADNLTSLGRALLYQAKYDEATAVLERALAVQKAAFGPNHPNVAEAVNELGNILAMQERYGEAAANFQRSADIYRSVHGEHHYFVAIALSNVAYMRMKQGRYDDAEALFRPVIQLFTDTLGADNVNTGIARIKLGRTLRLAGRLRDAETESLAGYEIVAAQANPAVSYLRAARDDLVLVYEATDQPEKAARFRGEIEALENAPPTGPALFAADESRLSEDEQGQLLGALTKIFPRSADGTRFEDPDCGDIGLEATPVDLNADGTFEVFVQWGNSCTSGTTGRSLLLFIRDAGGTYQPQLGFPAFGWTKRDSAGQEWPDLVLGGPGFCHAVWTFKDGEYTFRCNLPEEPGGCASRNDVCSE